MHARTHEINKVNYGSKVQGMLSVYIHIYACMCVCIYLFIYFIFRMEITNRQMLTTFSPAPEFSPGQERSLDARLLLWAWEFRIRRMINRKNN